LSNGQAEFIRMSRPHQSEIAVTASLTTQQIALLRRIGDGLGLPAYVLRPRNCSQDVELLHLFDLVESTSGTLSITFIGIDYLQRVESCAPGAAAANLPVLHGQDHSITGEYWPQEY
jgi:hypothetical protein